MSDIHGNRHALEAVVADAAGLGVDRWWVLGDLVAIGPDPVATDRADRRAPAGRGDQREHRALRADRRPSPTPRRRRAREPRPAPALRHGPSTRSPGPVARSTANGWLDWLRRLPPDVRMELPDGTVAVGVHAVRRAAMTVRGSRRTATRTKLAPTISPGPTRTSSSPATRTNPPTGSSARIRAVNLGSVSNPITDDLRASYAVLHSDRHGHAIEHRRVAYDPDGFLDSGGSVGTPLSGRLHRVVPGADEQVRHPAVRPGAPTPTA